jgi:nitroreductase
MNFTELARKRHTTKVYKNTQEMPQDILDQLLEATSLAPTALGAEQARVIVARTKEAKEIVAPGFMGFNATKVLTSNATFIFVGQTKKYLIDDEAKHLKENISFFDLNSEMGKNTLSGTVGWYNNDASRSEFLDIIAAGNKSSYLTLKATELNLASTIMTGLNYDTMENILRDHNLLAEGERAILGVTVGTEDETNEINQNVKNHKLRKPTDQFAAEIK